MTSIDPAFLDRYLAGECSAAEREAFERRLDENPEERRFVAALLRALDQADRTLTREEKAAMFISLPLGAPAPRPVPRSEIPVPRYRANPSFSFPTPVEPGGSAGRRAAVVLLATVGIAAAGWYAVRIAPRRAPAEIATRTVTTGRGQRATFRLPDGTRVILGVASSLTHPVAFGEGPREIRLQGEAYFDVPHDEQHPFVVFAGNVVAKDLGTEFVVRAYPGEGDGRVVVKAGRVALQAAGAEPASARVLDAGQLGRLADSGPPVVERVNPADYFAWTTGHLVFDATPLREALPELARWYDLDFRLADPALGEVPLTGTLDDQPTDGALDALAASLGMRQVRRGRVVTFYR